MLLGANLSWCLAAQSEAPPVWATKLAQKHEHPKFPRAADLLAVMRVESFYKPGVVNGEARGVMQVSGGSLDPDQNVQQGAKILSDLYQKFRSEKKALMVYNIGIGNYLDGNLLERGEDYARLVLTKRSALNSRRQTAARTWWASSRFPSRLGHFCPG